jgi:hypothetical protein
MAGKPKWRENPDRGKKMLVAEIQDLWKEQDRREQIPNGKKTKKKRKGIEEGYLLVFEVAGLWHTIRYDVFTYTHTQLHFHPLIPTVDSFYQLAHTEPN